MSASASVPVPGQIARVRQRLYLVEETVAPKNSADSTLVRLSCVDDDAQGQQLEVLWEREIDPEILTGEAWEEIARRGFDEPRLFAAYVNTLRWNCVTATNPRLLQSPFRAGIRLDAYQLEPLRKALLLPRVNLFIADDVGLGKTIEAGLIARELLLRKKVREIVVCCPPSMLLQWKDELEARFGLTFEILDKDYVKRVRRERGFGVNPWTTHSRFLVSQRLLIDEAYAGPLRDWLGAFQSGTLLILDEAHHAAPSSGQKYAIDSRITRAVRDLAPRFEHRLFLSATPHNGHSNSFSALLEILDPQRFCRGVPATKKMLESVMVRRLKDDVREVQGGFPKRHVVQIDIDGLPDDAPELALSHLLDQYRELREERLSGESKRKQAAAGLLIVGLQQRLLSSIEAFARTLRVHRRTVQRQWEQAQAASPPEPRGTSQMDLLAGSVSSDDDRAALSEEELQAEEDAQIEAATAESAASSADAAKLFAREQQLLDESLAILRVFERIEEFNRRPDRPVLILGPTGAGKTKIAKLIHLASKRRKEKFVPLRASDAMANEGIVRAEWLGYGPKSGISEADPEGRSGLLKEATGGTIFLDEVADLPEWFQVFLFAAIDREELRPMAGGGSPFKPDVRFVFATDRDLSAATEDSQFRHQFLRRIRENELRIPSLVERIEDVLFFAQAECGNRPRSAGFLLCLLRYSWPDNVAELLHVLKTAVTKTSSSKERLTLDHLELRDASIVEDVRAMTPDVAEVAVELERLQTEREQVRAELLRVAGTAMPSDVDAEARRIADQVWQLGQAMAKAKPETLRELIRQAVSRIVCRFQKGETSATGRTPCKLVKGKVLLRPSPFWSVLSTTGNNGTR